MDPTYTPGPGRPCSSSEGKRPENDRPALSPGLPSPRNSSKHNVGNEPFVFNGSVPEEPGPELLRAPAARGSSSAHRWAARIFLVIEVMVWIELGMILVVAPWTRAWGDNGLVLNYSQVRQFLNISFVRGAVTGIGLLDIWVGLWRAVHYRDPSNT